jgi:HlyD family secretion protein
MSRRSRHIALVFLVVVALVAGGGYYYRSQYAVSKAEAEEPELKTARARTGDIIITAGGLGSLVPAAEANLAFRSSGMLAELLVGVGDSVAKGDVLARLDGSDAQVQIAQAEINLRLAELKLAELEQEEESAAVVAAKSQVAQAEINLQQAALKAAELTADPDPVALATARSSLAAAESDLAKLQTPPTAEAILAATDNLVSARKALEAVVAGPTPEEIAIAEADLQLAEISAQVAQAAFDKVGQNLASPQAINLWQATTAFEKAQAVYEQKVAGTSEDQVAAARARVATAQSQLDALLAGPSAESVAAAVAKVTQATAQLDALLAGASEGDIQLADLEVDQARINLAQTQAQLDVALEGVSPEAIETAKLGVEQAKVNLTSAQTSSTALLAPMDGTVIEIKAAVGEIVGSSPIITLADLAFPLIEFHIEETDLDKVAVGYPAEITFDALPDDTLQGTVRFVSPVLTVVDGVPAVRVLAEIESSESSSSLRVGMAADVEITAASTKDAVLVPLEALRELGPDSYAVFVLKEDGSLEMRIVEVGLKDYTYAEIVSGLSKGEIVSTGTIETE